MGRFSKEEKGTIERAAGTLGLMGHNVIAQELWEMITPLPELTVQLVPERMTMLFEKTNKWTAGNEASKAMALLMNPKSQALRIRLLRQFAGSEDWFTNQDLYNIYPTYSLLTVNREVSNIQEVGFLVEGDMVPVGGGRVMTPRRIHPAFLEWMAGGQTDLWQGA